MDFEQRPLIIQANKSGYEKYPGGVEALPLSCARNEQIMNVQIE